MQFLKIVTVVSLTLNFLGGCGNNEERQGATANQASVGDLALLLADHPEISAASLHDIKVSSQKKKNQDDLSFALSTDLASKPSAADLNPELAKKAQDLVDEILDEFAFEAQISMFQKLAGIMINESKEMIKNFKTQFKEMEKNKDFSGPSKFDADLPEKEISCEDIVNNPYLKISKAEYERVNKANKKLIKEALSGCPKLATGKFLGCTKNFNTITTMINQHATCAMKSYEELQKSIDKTMDGKFAALDESVAKCMTEDFAKCNYKQEQPSEAPKSNNASKSDDGIHR